MLPRSIILIGREKDDDDEREIVEVKLTVRGVPPVTLIPMVAKAGDPAGTLRMALVESNDSVKIQADDVRFAGDYEYDLIPTHKQNFTLVLGQMPSGGLRGHCFQLIPKNERAAAETDVRIGFYVPYMLDAADGTIMPAEILKSKSHHRMLHSTRTTKN
jgi:hypothetical protein